MPRDSLSDRFPTRQMNPRARTETFLRRRANPALDGRPTPASRALGGGRGGGLGGPPSMPGNTQNVTELPADPNNAAPGRIYHLPGGPGEGSRLITVIENGDGSRSYRDVMQGADAWPAPYVGKWGSAGTANGQFGEMRGIAVDEVNGWVYVASDNRIQKFSLNGTYINTIATFGSGNGQVNAPSGLSIGLANGYLYVADTGNNRVQWFVNDVYGGQFGTLGSGDGQFNAPSDVYTSRASIFVADTGNNRWQRWAITPLAWGANSTGYTAPKGIALDWTRPFGPSIPNTTWIVDTGANRLVMKTGIDTVVVVGSFGAAKGQFNNPTKIAIDAQGNIHVTDTGNNRVQVFDNNGIFQGAYGQLGAGDDDLNAPTAIAITKDYTYVADNGNKRVVIRANPAAAARWEAEVSQTWAPAALGANAGQAINVSVPGAALGDFVKVSHTGARSNTYMVWLEAFVSAANNVLVTANNRNSAAAETLGSGTLRVRVTR